MKAAILDGFRNWAHFQTIGTSIGLQDSTAAGSALWILAAAIMASNVAWVIWRVLRQRGHAKDQR